MWRGSGEPGKTPLLLSRISSKPVRTISGEVAVRWSRCWAAQKL